MCGNGTEPDTEIDYSGRYSMGGDLGKSPVLKFSRSDSRGRWTYQNTSLPESDTDEGKPLNQKRSKVESGKSQEATSQAQGILESPVGGEPLGQKEHSFVSLPSETTQSPVQQDTHLEERISTSDVQHVPVLDASETMASRVHLILQVRPQEQQEADAQRLACHLAFLKDEEFA